MKNDARRGRTAGTIANNFSDIYNHLLSKPDFNDIERTDDDELHPLLLLVPHALSDQDVDIENRQLQPLRQFPPHCSANRLQLRLFRYARGGRMWQRLGRWIRLGDRREESRRVEGVGGGGRGNGGLEDRLGRLADYVHLHDPCVVS